MVRIAGTKVLISYNFCTFLPDALRFAGLNIYALNIAVAILARAAEAPNGKVVGTTFYLEAWFRIHTMPN